MKHIMLDLETLGNKPGAVIASIGAVWFGGGKIGGEFYLRVSPQSCLDLGLTMDVETVLWWLQQNAEARAELVNQTDVFHIAAALQRFEQFIQQSEKPEEVCLWGNGADFDNVILAAAYRAVGNEVPWKFYNNRCYRTLKSLRPELKIVRTGTAHNALADARSQSIHLMQLFPNLT